DYGDAAAGPSLVVPAGYAFGIWAPIYAGLFSHAVYQALPARRRDPVLRRTGWATACAVGLSGFWVWAQDAPGLELSLIAVTAAAAVTAYTRAAPVLPTEAASVRDRWLVQVPLGLFSGWITVATVAGSGEALITSGISAPWPGAEAWSTAALMAAGGAAAGLAWWRPISLAYAAAVTWGLAGVAVRVLPQHPAPGTAALVAGAAVAAAGVAGARRRRAARAGAGRASGTGTAAPTP
ncbi:MAG TPA: hypothetical protein VF867_10740, partial [Arthrobacter sp.]